MLRDSALALAFRLLFGNSIGAPAQNLFFVPPTFPGTGQAATADLKGDGKADLVFADGTVLIGNADGTLHTGTSWSIIGDRRFRR